MLEMEKQTNLLTCISCTSKNSEIRGGGGGGGMGRENCEYIE